MERMLNDKTLPYKDTLKLLSFIGSALQMLPILETLPLTEPAKAKLANIRVSLDQRSIRSSGKYREMIANPSFFNLNSIINLSPLFYVILDEVNNDNKISNDIKLSLSAPMSRIGEIYSHYSNPKKVIPAINPRIFKNI